MISDERKQVYRTVRNIASPVAIQIVPAILAPVVALVMVEVALRIGDHLKSVAQKVVVNDLVVQTVSLNVECFAIGDEAVLLNHHAVGSFGVNTYRISVKSVELHFTIGNFLKQNAVGSTAPVFFKGIVEHGNVFRKHHCDTRAVVFKGVVLVYIVVRKHK